MEKGFVYIIQSQTSGRYYIGCCKIIIARLAAHNNDEVTATRNKGPWILKFTEEFSTMREARQMEYKLKQLKRKDYLEQIIKDGFIRKK